MIPSRPKVVLLGGTGFVGTDLAHSLKQDHEVVLLRSRLCGPGGYDVEAGWMDADVLRGADAIVNLAGSPIAVRWNKSVRAEILSSRAGTNRLLVDTLARAGLAPRVVISLSGINRYAADPEAEIDESSPLDSSGFLGSVCRAWEAPLADLPSTTRGVILPTGVVIGPGGALLKMAPTFRLGLGGRLGSGRQWMSWIALHDLTRLIRRCLAANGPSGVVNAVDPHPVRNADFTRTLAKVMGRPALLPVPAWVLRLAFGHMAQEALLESRRVLPRRAVALGFRFGGPDALEHAIHLGLRR